jgi:hypothetical protein
VESLQYDTMFKKAFCHVDLFTGLVKDFTGIPLEIEKVEHDKVFDEQVGNVKTKFDLFAEDNRVIVDAELANYSDNFDKFLYHHLIAMLETIATSKNDYSPITVISLVFFTDKISPSPDSCILFLGSEPKNLSGQTIKNVIKQEHRLCLYQRVCSCRYTGAMPRLDGGYPRYAR